MGSRGRGGASDSIEHGEGGGACQSRLAVVSRGCQNHVTHLETDHNAG